MPAIVSSTAPGSRAIANASPDGSISLGAAELTYRNLAMFDDTLKRAHIDLAKTFDNSFVERAPALRAK